MMNAANDATEQFNNHAADCVLSTGGAATAENARQAILDGFARQRDELQEGVHYDPTLLEAYDLFMRVRDGADRNHMYDADRACANLEDFLNRVDGYRSYYRERPLSRMQGVSLRSSLNLWFRIAETEGQREYWRNRYRCDPIAYKVDGQIFHSIYSCTRCLSRYGCRCDILDQDQRERLNAMHYCDRFLDMACAECEPPPAPAATTEAA